MKVALFGSGESSRTTWPTVDADAYDQLVMINRGAIWPGAPRADWWVVIDVTFALNREHKPAQRPGGIVSYPSTVGRMMTSAFYPDWFTAPRLAECPIDFFPIPELPTAPLRAPDKRPVKWSIEVAMCFAAGVLCADEIDLFGVDMRSDRNVLGGRNPSHTKNLWDRQWAAVRRHLAYLSGRGHAPTIRRVLPDSVVEVKA